MRRMIIAWLLVGAPLVAALGGCMSPKGATVDDKRAYVQNMRRSALHELLERQPAAKAEIDSAAGYAVFSDVGTHFIFTAGDQGYGVVHNNKTGQDIYMRMAELGGGLGLGLQKFKAVLVFKDEAVLRQFVTSGWEFAAEATGAARVEGKGAGASGAESLNRGIKIFRFTSTGIMAEVTLGGSKYWRDSELN